MDGRTALAVLGLEPGATTHDIKLAFRAQAKVAHPDASGNADDFVGLRLAYDAARRAATPDASAPKKAVRWFGSASPNPRIDLVDTAGVARPRPPTAPGPSGVAMAERAFADLLRQELANA